MVNTANNVGNAVFDNAEDIMQPTASGYQTQVNFRNKGEFGDPYSHNHKPAKIKKHKRSNTSAYELNDSFDHPDSEFGKPHDFVYYENGYSQPMSAHSISCSKCQSLPKPSHQAQSNGNGLSSNHLMNGPHHHQGYFVYDNNGVSSHNQNQINHKSKSTSLIQ